MKQEHKDEIITFVVNASAVTCLIMPVLMKVVYPLFERIMQNPDLEDIDRIAATMLMTASVMAYAHGCGILIGTLNAKWRFYRNNKKGKQ